eukprot:6458006-Alexandrium_andersonii.AAC.1
MPAGLRRRAPNLHLGQYEYVRLARIAVGPGPNGGTGAPSRAKLRLPGRKRKNNCSKSVDDSARLVSEACVSCCPSAERLVVASGVLPRVSETWKFGAQKGRELQALRSRGRSSDSSVMEACGGGRPARGDSPIPPPSTRTPQLFWSG